MFQVFDHLFEATEWIAAIDYAKQLASEHRTEIRVYRDSVLVAIVQPATIH